MARRAPSRLSAVLGAGLLLGAGGMTSTPATPPWTFVPVDVSAIPADTVDASSPDLVEANGLFVLRGAPFTGFVREMYDGQHVKRVTSVSAGLRHGTTRSFFPSGRPRDVRSYRDNLAYGRHFGFWDNGTMKFDFQYRDDRREGLQLQWYESGKPYALLSFRDDREEGMQKAWRESGKLYINYEARGGKRFGLQKSALCAEITEDYAR